MTNKDGISVEETRALLERLRKMARCVYLATEASVADDISDGLTKAADLTLALSEREAAKDAEIARLREALETIGDGRLGDQAWSYARAALTQGKD